MNYLLLNIFQMPRNSRLKLTMSQTEIQNGHLKTIVISRHSCPSLNFFLEPEPSFFLQVYFAQARARAFLVLPLCRSQSQSFFCFAVLGEPEPELFWFRFFGGAGARAFFGSSIWKELEQSFIFLSYNKGPNKHSSAFNSAII